MGLEWRRIGDVQQPVLSFGVPDGRPVLLLPGLTDGLAPISDPDARAQLREPPGDLQARYRIHVVSHRFPALAPLTTRTLALDAAHLLETLTDRPAIVVGHSMGAMVAQHLAADRPELVDRLVLSCTVARADDGFREVLARWATLVAAERWRAFFRDAVDASYTGSDLLRRRVAQRVLPFRAPDPELKDRHLVLTEACGTHDALDRLADVRAPALVLAGGRDEVTAPHHGEQLAAALPDARLERWEPFGHGLPEQAADRFGRRLVRFLEDGT
ncbi:alpha/beta hydrolase [Nitriliruptoraceae bacterium ZYF776]|nr:alpha/beta hydrolase [Profundirhabdus halotolerans]